MGALIGYGILLGFMAAQGGVIFITAYLCRRLLQAPSWAKPILVAFSYVFWVVVTVGGYTALGGEGGLMDGFGFLLTLLFSALISSFAFTALWLAYPLVQFTGRNSSR